MATTASPRAADNSLRDKADRHGEVDHAGDEARPMDHAARRGHEKQKEETKCTRLLCSLQDTKEGAEHKATCRRGVVGSRLKHSSASIERPHLSDCFDVGHVGR